MVLGSEAANKFPKQRVWYKPLGIVQFFSKTCDIRGFEGILRCLTECPGAQLVMNSSAARRMKLQTPANSSQEDCRDPAATSSLV